MEIFNVSTINTKIKRVAYFVLGVVIHMGIKLLTEDIGKGDDQIIDRSIAGHKKLFGLIRIS